MPSRTRFRRVIDGGITFNYKFNDLLWWCRDGTTKDYGPLNRTVTQYGNAAYLTSGDPFVIQYENSSRWAQLSAGSVTLSGSVTMMGWYRGKSGGNYAGDNNAGMILACGFSGVQRYLSTTVWRFYNGASTAFTLPADYIWRHFTITVKGTLIKIYIDGIFVKEETIAGLNINGPMLISGGYNNNYSAAANGCYSDVRFYYGTFTAAEIAGLYKVLKKPTG